MAPKITDEQRQAIQAGRGQAVDVEDDQTHRLYVLLDRSTYQRQSEALHRLEDLVSIQAGIKDMEAGRVIPFEQVDARIRKELGLPARR